MSVKIKWFVPKTQEYLLEIIKMRIAICDDNALELDQWHQEIQYQNIRVFSSGILQQRKANQNEAGFCGVPITVKNRRELSMQVAQEVREFGETIQIAFLTSSADYAVESYSVDAAACILKHVLTFTGKVVPVSRRLFAQVRKAYADNLFAEKGLDW